MYKVYVLTTDGPVQVERIAWEPGVGQSTICLGRTHKELPIKLDYDAFVRRQTGIVLREFGPAEPGGFRLDVSGSISGGDSWQLAIYLAHGLSAQGLLAGLNDSAEAVILATGSVDHDLKIGAVNHIAVKANAMQALVEESNIPVSILLPQSGDIEVGDMSTLSHVSVLGVSHAADTLRIFLSTATYDKQTDTKSTLAPVPDHAPSVIERDLLNSEHLRPLGDAAQTLIAMVSRRMVSIAVIVLALSAFSVAGLVWVRSFAVVDAVLASSATFESVDDIVSNLANGSVLDRLVLDVAGQRIQGRLQPPSINVAFVTAPDGATCPMVHMDSKRGVVTPIDSNVSGRLSTRIGAEVCGLGLAVEAGAAPRFILVLVEPMEGDVPRDLQPARRLDGRQPQSGEITWSSPIIRQQRDGFVYRLTLLSAEFPLDEAISVFRNLEVSARSPYASARGIAISTVEHSLKPAF